MRGIVAIIVLVTTPFIGALAFARVYGGASWKHPGAFNVCERLVFAASVGIMAVNGWMLLWDRVLDWSGAR